MRAPENAGLPDKLVLPEAPHGEWAAVIHIRTGTKLVQYQAVVTANAEGSFELPLDLPPDSVPSSERWSDVTIRMSDPDSADERASEWVAANLLAKRVGGTIRLATRQEAAADPAYWSVSASMPGLAQHLASQDVVVRVVANPGEEVVEVLPDEDPALAPPGPPVDWGVDQ